MGGNFLRISSGAFPGKSNGSELVEVKMVNLSIGHLIEIQQQSRYIVLDIHKWKPGSLGLNIGGYGIVNPLLHSHHVSLLPWKWLGSSIAIQMEGVFESTFIHPIFNTETKVANQPGRFALSQWYHPQTSTIHHIVMFQSSFYLVMLRGSFQA